MLLCGSVEQQKGERKFSFSFCLNKYMESESFLVTTEEVNRLIKLKAAGLETDEDLIKLADIFDEDAETEESEDAAEPEQTKD